MKRVAFLALYFLVIPGLFGCSIDVGQPAIPSPTFSPTTKPENIATSSLPTTQIPVTWTSLNLIGSLVYISTDTLDNSASPGIQILDLATGEVSTIFRAPKGAWIYYLTVSPDAKQLVMSYIPPSQGTSLSSRTLYIMPLDGPLRLNFYFHRQLLTIIIFRPNGHRMGSIFTMPTTIVMIHLMLHSFRPMIFSE